MCTLCFHTVSPLSPLRPGSPMAPWRPVAPCKGRHVHTIKKWRRTNTSGRLWKRNFWSDTNYYSKATIDDLFTLGTWNTRCTDFSLWEMKTYFKSHRRENSHCSVEMIEERKLPWEDKMLSFTLSPEGQEQFTSGPLFCSPTVGVGVGISTGGASVTTFLGHCKL